MNEVEGLLAPESRETREIAILDVVLIVEENMRIDRRSAWKADGSSQRVYFSTIRRRPPRKVSASTNASETITTIAETAATVGSIRSDM